MTNKCLNHVCMYWYKREAGWNDGNMLLNSVFGSTADIWAAGWILFNCTSGGREPRCAVRWWITGPIRGGGELLSGSRITVQQPWSTWHINWVRGQQTEVCPQIGTPGQASPTPPQEVTCALLTIFPELWNEFLGRDDWLSAVWWCCCTGEEGLLWLRLHLQKHRKGLID